MKETFLMFARYGKEANESICSILDTLSNDDREKKRGSYYGSLSGLFRHVLGGTAFFTGIFKKALEGNPKASAVLNALQPVNIPKDTLSDAQWAELKSALPIIDDTLIALISALDDEDFSTPVKTDWYGGNPAEVPLSFMINSLIAHGTHHRGQISQILDELDIPNDYSGINIAFLSEHE
jgi:uncharacterized damage-inducible protein DinB